MDISAPNLYADDFVSHINDLPSLGANVSELLVMLDSPHANFFKIAKLVRQDPVLSSKVLRVANSALYYSGLSLTSLETAMSRLGMNELRHIAMASSMMDTFFLVGNTMDIEAFWRHCLGSANASVLLARRAKNLSQAEKSNGSTFYTCGLLHHLGILLEAWVSPDKFKYALQISTARAIPFFQAEKEIFGFSHAESGAALLRRWKFPEVVVESALFHHDPE
jgi:HD-like signal output (HDOD) protein